LRFCFACTVLVLFGIYLAESESGHTRHQGKIAVAIMYGDFHVRMYDFTCEPDRVEMDLRFMLQHYSRVEEESQ